MSFSINISGHVNGAPDDVARVEDEILSDLGALIDKLRSAGHTAGGSYFGPSGTKPLGSDAAPAPDLPQAAGASDVATHTVDTPQSAPAGEQAGDTVPPLQDEVADGSDVAATEAPADNTAEGESTV